MTPLLSLRGRLRPAETIFSLLSLRGAEGDEAISVEGRGNMCIDVVAGFIPALWSAERKLPCA